MEIKVYQHDWMPGFAAFLDDGSIDEKAEAYISLNLGDFLALVHEGDIDSKELPYQIAERLMHEVIHVLEAWAKVEFSEEKVEALLDKYRENAHV